MFSENLAKIKKHCSDAQNKYERAESNIRILAVGKSQKLESIAEAIQAGQCDFGENYLQELQQKIAYLQSISLSAYAKWHFIGHIQSRKAGDIAQLCHWVHSVDRLSIAKKLSQSRPPDMSPLNICIQVNLDCEESKSGILPDEVIAFSKEVSCFPNIVVRGLMAIPAPRESFSEQRKSLSRLYDLKAMVVKEVTTVDSLSMGMSDDFEAAIAEGATMIRIGTALFGPRIKQQQSIG